MNALSTQNTGIGVYRLYHPETGQSFVGFSRHMESTRKRLAFELKLNACSYKPLQAYYNQCGGLVFECLEIYAPAPNETDLEIDAHLTALLLKHKTVLNAELIQVQV